MLTLYPVPRTVHRAEEINTWEAVKRTHQMQEQGGWLKVSTTTRQSSGLLEDRKTQRWVRRSLFLAAIAALSLGGMPGKWHRTARPVLPGPASGAGVLLLPGSQSCLPASARKLTTWRPEDFTSLAATKMRPPGHRYNQNTVREAYPWEPCFAFRFCLPCLYTRLHRHQHTPLTDLLARWGHAQLIIQHWPSSGSFLKPAAHLPSLPNHDSVGCLRAHKLSKHAQRHITRANVIGITCQVPVFPLAISPLKRCYSYIIFMNEICEGPASLSHLQWHMWQAEIRTSSYCWGHANLRATGLHLAAFPFLKLIFICWGP